MMDLTFSMPALESQSFFVWCTPHSPMWNTRGPFIIITCIIIIIIIVMIIRNLLTCSFSLRQCCEICCRDQSQL